MGNNCIQDGSFCAFQGQSQLSSAIGNHSIQGVIVYTPQVQSQRPLAIGNHSIQGVTVYTLQVQSQRPLAIGNHSIQGVTVYTLQGQSQPSFIMGSNYVEGHGHGVYSSQSRPVSQSQPPMGRTSVYHVTYPTYDRLVQHQPTQFPTSEELSIGKIKFKAFDLGGHVIARRVWKDYYAQKKIEAFREDEVALDFKKELDGNFIQPSTSTAAPSNLSLHMVHESTS
ncbi:GTP-binding protein SAR1 [Camellia lanceoleosa]|uniref:GTP-binding protein SAR1 n=1 Tax=Camellia lanceoleosa TaxID=1840588 RepID=A0ACC0HAP4_9ERIC|nr:GTP-binding protein SAR1 [Camellia lanceoleosa]